MRPLYFVLFFALFSCNSINNLNQSSNELTDGAIQKSTESVKAWDSESNQWLSVEDFWLSYAKRNGGLTWGKGSEYPPYNQVKEFDTFLVELDQGTCLMEFFHERWRRANDVRRWDDQHNEYSACPYVFD